jgi:hypothetical protein
MIALGNRVPRHPYGTSLSASINPRESASDFQLHVPSPADLSPMQRADLCALGPRFGIEGSVRFRVTTGDINNHPDTQQGFVCERGRVAA